MTTLTYEPATGQGDLSAIARIVMMVGTAWFLLAAAISLAGGFDAAVGEKPVAILLAIAAPILTFWLAYARVPAFRKWLLGLDMRHLILLHSWRMIGMGFVFLYFHDLLPALFALPAGLGDAMAAVGAIFLAIALYDNASAVSRKRIFAWNTFGLVDFIVAVSMGVLTRTGEVFHISGAAGSEIMGIFPLALIPAFGVPFYIITHLVIYAQLRQNAA